MPNHVCQLINQLSNHYILSMLFVQLIQIRDYNVYCAIEKLLLSYYCNITRIHIHIHVHNRSED